LPLNTKAGLSIPIHAYHLKEAPVLWTIFVILLILWLLGMVSSYTLGGFIHILLVLAIVAVIIRVIQGRSPV
jgi:asparagine N-glycosylation enzyme membrane subunit Stt3